MFWTMVGIGVGATVGVAVIRWAQRTTEKLSPPNLAREAGSRGGELLARVREAVDEGRKAMVAREAELRAELGLPRL